MTPGSIEPKKRIAAFLFPRYSVFLDKLNWNAKWAATIKEANEIPLFPTRDRLHRFVQAKTGNGPINYLEFGVWTGASLRLWCDANTHSDSRFFGFDSFKGLPEHYSAMFPKGAFNTDGAIPNIQDRMASVLYQKEIPA